MARNAKDNPKSDYWAKRCREKVPPEGVEPLASPRGGFSYLFARVFAFVVLLILVLLACWLVYFATGCSKRPQPGLPTVYVSPADDSGIDPKEFD